MPVRMRAKRVHHNFVDAALIRPDTQHSSYDQNGMGLLSGKVQGERFQRSWREVTLGMDTRSVSILGLRINTKRSG